MKKYNKKPIVLALSLLFLAGCGSSNALSTKFSEPNFEMDNYASDSYDYGYSNGYSYNVKSNSAGIQSDSYMYAEESAMVDVAFEPSLSIETQSKQNVATNRKLIKDVSLNVETENLDNFIVELRNNVDEIGGYIENSSISGSSISSSRKGYRSATFSVRVPQDKLDDFVNYVENGANITQKNENVEDVTLTYHDTETRKQTLTAERTRLLNLLDQAEDLSDVILIEDKLSDIEYEIDNLTSRLKTYDSLVEYSTINMRIEEVEKYTPVEFKTPTMGERIVNGFKENLDEVKDNLEDFVVWFVSSIPHLVIFAIFVLIFVLIIKLIIKKHKNKPAKPITTENPYQNAVSSKNNAYSSIPPTVAPKDENKENGEQK